MKEKMGRSYLKVGVRLPVVPSVIYVHLDILSHSGPPHLQGSEKTERHGRVMTPVSTDRLSQKQPIREKHDSSPRVTLSGHQNQNQFWFRSPEVVMVDQDVFGWTIGNISIHGPPTDA